MMLGSDAWITQADRLFRPCLPFVASGLLACADSVPANSDSTLPDVRVVGEAMCAECSISLVRLARLGSLQGPDAFGEFGFTKFAVNSKGDIFASSLPTWGDVLRFDRSGAYLGKVGRTGEGPGEQQLVTHLAVAAADTLYVIDAKSRILNRFAPSGEFIDRTLLPGEFREAVPLPGRRLLVSGRMRTTDAIGFPLHVVDSTGIAISFGEEVDRVTPGLASRLMRILATSPDGGLWSAKHEEYAIERWSAPGILEFSLRRTTTWFMPSEGKSSPQPMMAPPAPIIHGLTDAGDGYLWVHILVPDPEWRPGRLKHDPATGMDFLMEHSMDPFFDSVIEVIDVSRQQVIARLQDDRVLTPVGNRLIVYSYIEDDLGVPYYQLWRVRLTHS